MAEKLEIAIDGRKAETGAEQVEGAFDDMVKAATGAADRMDNAGDKIDDSFDDNAKHADKAGTGVIDFKKAFVFTAAIAGVVALAVSIQAVVTDVDALGKAASKANVSVDFFQRLEFAASQSGVELATVEGLMKDLTIRLGQAATGSKPMIEAFKGIGVEIRNVDGSLKTVEQIFPEVADGIAGLGSDAERAAVGVSLMGEAFTQANNLLKGGSETFTDLGNKAAELGIIMSEDTFAAAAELNDQMDILTRIVKTNFASALTALAPILIDTVQFISNMTIGIGYASTALLEFIGIGIKPKMEELATGADESEKRFINLTLSIARAKKALQDLDGKNPEAEAAIRERIAGMVAIKENIDLSRDSQEGANKEAIAANANALRWAEVLEGAEEKRFQKQLENIETRKLAEQEALKSQIGIGAEPLEEEATVGITAKQEQLRAETDLIAASLLTQEEIQMQHLINQQTAIEEAVEQRVITQQRGMELITAIDEKETRKRILIGAGAVSTAIGGFVQLAQAFSDNNGEMTAGAKALATTQVIINTAVGIMKSYADLGPIAGSFAAIGVAAAGVAQLGTIHGAGGGGGSISGTSAGLSTPQQPAFESTANIEREEQGGKEVNIYVSGVAPREYIESDLLPLMSDVINENDIVLFNNQSRQAVEIGG